MPDNLPIAAEVEVAGHPLAVTLHERGFTRAGGLWRCHGTVDI